MKDILVIAITMKAHQIRLRGTCKKRDGWPVVVKVTQAPRTRSRRSVEHNVTGAMRFKHHKTTETSSALSTRRLAAILVADVVSYSRLMETDEAGTLAQIKSLRNAVVEPLAARHGGRVVKFLGDGVIVEFASVVQAVECAIATQKMITESQAGISPGRRIIFRIGINLGDVVVEGNDLLGDGVNVAARLQELCEPGGVLISNTAHDHLQGKLSVPFDFVGDRRMKNISRPVATYRMRTQEGRKKWFHYERAHLERLMSKVALIVGLLLAAGT